MTALTFETLRQFLLERLETELDAIGKDADTLPDDFDLLDEGVIDSLGLLELLSAIEERFAIRMDWEDIDPEALAKVGPLCRYIYASAPDESSP